MFPSVGGTDIDSVTETKQSSICFIELFFTMVNDFRVQRVSSHTNPLYLKSLEITLPGGRTSFFLNTRTSVSVFPQLYLFNSSLSFKKKKSVIFPVTSTLLFLDPVFCSAFQKSMKITLKPNFNYLFPSLSLPPWLEPLASTDHALFNSTDP